MLVIHLYNHFVGTSWTQRYDAHVSKHLSYFPVYDLTIIYTGTKSNWNLEPRRHLKSFWLKMSLTVNSFVLANSVFSLRCHHYLSFCFQSKFLSKFKQKWAVKWFWRPLRIAASTWWSFSSSLRLVWSTWSQISQRKLFSIGIMKEDTINDSKPLPSQEMEVMAVWILHCCFCLTKARWGKQSFVFFALPFWIFKRKITKKFCFSYASSALSSVLNNLNNKVCMYVCRSVGAEHQVPWYTMNYFNTT